MAPMIAMISERQHTTDRMLGQWRLRDWHPLSSESEERGPVGLSRGRFRLGSVQIVHEIARIDEGRPQIHVTGHGDEHGAEGARTGWSHVLLPPSSGTRPAPTPGTEHVRKGSRGTRRRSRRCSTAGAPSGPVEQTAVIRPGNAQVQPRLRRPGCGGPCPASHGGSRRDRDLPGSHARVVAVPGTCARGTRALFGFVPVLF